MTPAEIRAIDKPRCRRCDGEERCYNCFHVWEAHTAHVMGVAYSTTYRVCPAAWAHYLDGEISEGRMTNSTFAPYTCGRCAGSGKEPQRVAEIISAGIRVQRDLAAARAADRRRRAVAR